MPPGRHKRLIQTVRALQFDYLRAVAAAGVSNQLQLQPLVGGPHGVGSCSEPVQELRAPGEVLLAWTCHVSTDLLTNLSILLLYTSAILVGGSSRLTAVII